MKQTSNGSRDFPDG